MRPILLQFEAAEALAADQRAGDRAVEIKVPDHKLVADSQEVGGTAAETTLSGTRIEQSVRFLLCNTTLVEFRVRFTRDEGRSTSLTTWHRAQVSRGFAKS